MSYDPSTTLGQVRFYCADTDYTALIFSDGELTMLLNGDGKGNVKLTAALALYALASDQAKLAFRVKAGGDAQDRTRVAAEVRAQADALMAVCGVAPVVNSPDQIFSTDSGNGTVIGTMTGW